MDGKELQSEISSAGAETLFQQMKEHQIDPIKEKLGKCYTQEDFQKFQEDVEKIVGKTIEGESRDKVKTIAIESAKDYYHENAWKQKTFWIPMGINVALLGIALLAVFKG